MAYAEIEINLDDLKDKIKYNYCENGNCLINMPNSTFAERFIQYVRDLKYDIDFRHEKKKTDEIIRVLENFKEELEANV